MATTQTTDLSTVTTAYELLSYFALRQQLYFDPVADVKPTNQSHDGDTVRWTIYNDIAPQITALNQVTDPTPVSLSDSTATVTLVEQGATVQVTGKLRSVSFF